MSAEIKNFYLNTLLDHPEYMKLSIDLIPDEIIEEYDLLSIVYYKGMVFMQIGRSMYGLLKLESFPTSSLPNICPKLDTTKCQTHQP
jgi:hypothetical protein